MGQRIHVVDQQALFPDVDDKILVDLEDFLLLVARDFAVFELFLAFLLLVSENCVADALEWVLLF